MKWILQCQCFVKVCLRPTDHHFISAKEAKQNGNKSIGLSGCLHITANVQPGCICTCTVRGDTSRIQSLHNEEFPSQWKGLGLSYHQLVTHIPLTYNIGNIWSRLFTNTIMTSLTIPQSILTEKKPHQNTPGSNLEATRDSKYMYFINFRDLLELDASS